MYALKKIGKAPLRIEIINSLNIEFLIPECGYFILAIWREESIIESVKVSFQSLQGIKTEV
ncbi:hypothetical protein D0A34_25915 [Microcoleus vaginatus PCC 9802]|nr:hypothetical protein MicvaDRAFT_3344 [Microcoleus vaginatus FGP-2]UNU21821.1 hypothetical protein D0A34_25915 [Microcoleus vaginatus PCC 9802]